MRYLLDVNVLMALGWANSVDYPRANQWIAEVSRAPGTKLLTSSIPQLGFVRVSVQRYRGQMSVADAARGLRIMLESLGERHEFVADDIGSVSDWPDWCNTAAKTTDAHLIALAARHGAKLATLDKSIPGALLLLE